jgi:hypothetical protein
MNSENFYDKLGDELLVYSSKYKIYPLEREGNSKKSKETITVRALTIKKPSLLPKSKLEEICREFLESSKNEIKFELIYSRYDNIFKTIEISTPINIIPMHIYDDHIKIELNKENFYEEDLGDNAINLIKKLLNVAAEN